MKLLDVRRPILVAAIGSPCPYCGEPMNTPDRAPSRDHIKPVHHGGSLEDPANRVVVCRRCNQDKGSRSLRRFHKWLVRTGDPRAGHVGAFMRGLDDRPAT